ncbi:MAG: hypothetical protein ACLQKK_20545 [Rhodomicrobium sp.]
MNIEAAEHCKDRNEQGGNPECGNPLVRFQPPPQGREFAVCIKAQASAAETVAADIIESRTPDQSAENIRLTHTRAPLFFMLTFVNENEMP